MGWTGASCFPALVTNLVKRNDVGGRRKHPDAWRSGTASQVDADLIRPWPSLLDRTASSGWPVSPVASPAGSLLSHRYGTPANMPTRRSARQNGQSCAAPSPDDQGRPAAVLTKMLVPGKSHQMDQRQRQPDGDRRGSGRELAAPMTTDGILVASTTCARTPAEVGRAGAGRSRGGASLGAAEAGCAGTHSVDMTAASRAPRKRTDI